MWIMVACCGEPRDSGGDLTKGLSSARPLAASERCRVGRGTRHATWSARTVAASDRSHVGRETGQAT